tara:strand:+ start:12708 stop:12932 length:225 start_codon:yes stop_codon:yes gene_type:complete
MNWLRKRFAEKSTYLGLATTILGLGTITKAKEAPQVAEAIAQASDSLSSGDYTTGGVMLLVGILGAFMKEKTKY